MPGEKAGWLHNPTPSKTVPSSGWMYADGGWSQDGSGIWHDDPSLTVTPGPLPLLARKFTVTGSGAAGEKGPQCLGGFTRTHRWWRGRPVYVNTKGQLLYHGRVDDGWKIGSKLGKYLLNKRIPLSPQPSH